MPYDDDPHVERWFREALGDPRPAVRRSAVELLARCRFPAAVSLLERSCGDADRSVSSAALLVIAEEALAPGAETIELMESDLAVGLDSPDLEWEWEYGIRACRKQELPGPVVRVWTSEEDDPVAKEVALIKSYPFGGPSDVVAIVVEKRLVTRYTRSPRSAREIELWRRSGRPRYCE